MIHAEVPMTELYAWIFFVVVGAVAAAGLVLWRRPRRHARTVDEALEQQALDRAADRQLDEAIYHADLTNLRR
jgi:hypothetical protein